MKYRDKKVVDIKTARKNKTHTCACCGDVIPKRVKKGASECPGIGLFFGPETFITLSDGSSYKDPEAIVDLLQSIKRLKRDHKKAKEGSEAFVMIPLLMAKMYRKLHEFREQLCIDISDDIASEYTNVYVEDIDYKKLPKKWRQRLQDFGHAELLEMLAKKCNLIKIPPTETENY